MASAIDSDAAVVAKCMQDYKTLLRRTGVSPRHLKNRLRRMGIPAAHIEACTDRENLLELLLFAPLPSLDSAWVTIAAFFAGMLVHQLADAHFD